MTTVELVTLGATFVALATVLIKLRRERGRPASPFARWFRDRRPTPPDDSRPE
jgi:hypothetical protein